MSKDGKKLLSRWDKIWVIIVIIILTYIVLQKFGINLIERTEEMELIQKPHKD